MTSPSILVVEDDPSIRDALAQVLGIGGYDVEAASDGAAALGRLRAGLRPGLVLCDLVMPTMDGWELCAEMARHPELARIPVVVLSAAWNLHSERTSGLKPAAALLKPINFKRLFELVERFCGSPAPVPHEAPVPPAAPRAKKAN